jgi:hypothetical protein
MNMPVKFLEILNKFSDHMHKLAEDDVPGSPVAHVLMTLGTLCVSYPFDADFTLGDFRTFGQNMLEAVLKAMSESGDMACDCPGCAAMRNSLSALNELTSSEPATTESEPGTTEADSAARNAAQNAAMLKLFNAKPVRGQC